MKKLTLIISLVFIFKMVGAQEEAIYAHYHINPLLINPATAGMDEGHHNLFMNFRSSWAGFPGQPKTYAISYSGPIGKRLGLGALLYSENIGHITRYRAQLSYSFRYRIKENLRLGMGLSTEFHRMSVTDINDNPLNEAGDLTVSEAMNGDNVFDASLGLYLEHKNGLYGGITIPNLIRARLDNIDNEEEDTKPFDHYLINFGGRFKLEKSNMTVEPSILIKDVRTAPFLVDMNMIVSFLKEQLITGLTYRAGNGGAMALLLGTKYKSLKFYYTYDVSFGNFQQYNSGSHEVTVSFGFERKEGNYDRSRKFR